MPAPAFVSLAKADKDNAVQKLFAYQKARCYKERTLWKIGC
jgi:hypothetical protein